MPPHRYSDEERKAFKLRRKQLMLFSRFDEGIRLSDQMLYSVTAEEIAHRIAQKAYEKGFRTVVDGCGGCGGSTIAFAENGFQVASVELDPSTLSDAKHNSSIYMVTDWIQFFQMDILKFDCRKEAGFEPSDTLLFSSPEWGGPSYKQQEVFDLENLNPSVTDMLAYARKLGYRETCLHVPRTTDLKQAEKLGSYECEYLFLNGWCHAICLWFKTGKPSDEDSDNDNQSSNEEVPAEGDGRDKDAEKRKKRLEENDKPTEKAASENSSEKEEPRKEYAQRSKESDGKAT